MVCRRAGGGQGGNPMGPMGGPMDFGRNKSKFQEVPETGITFDDVAVSPHWSQRGASARYWSNDLSWLRSLSEALFLGASS